MAQPPGGPGGYPPYPPAGMYMPPMNMPGYGFPPGMPGMPGMPGGMGMPQMPMPGAGYGGMGGMPPFHMGGMPGGPPMGMHGHGGMPGMGQMVVSGGPSRVYTGPPPADKIKRNDPETINRLNGGPALHSLDSPMPEARTVYAGNIPSSVTEVQLAEWCTAITNSRPRRLKMVHDVSKPTQYGFVEFETVAAAHSAIGASGTECAGNGIKICQAKGTVSGGPALSGAEIETADDLEVKNRTVYVNQLDGTFSEPMLREWFENKCGRVKQVRLCGDAASPTRYCFVEFESIESALLCKSLSGTSLGAHQIKCSDSKVNLYKPVNSQPAQGSQSEATTRTVHVGNLDIKITEHELREFFSQCGNIKHIYIVSADEGAPTRYGFVEFFERESVARAFELTNSLIGAYNIRVNYAKGVIPTETAAPAVPGVGVLARSAGTDAAKQLDPAYVVALQQETNKYLLWKAAQAKKDSRGRTSGRSDAATRSGRGRKRSRSPSSDSSSGDSRRRRKKDRR